MSNLTKLKGKAITCYAIVPKEGNRYESFCNGVNLTDKDAKEWEKQGQKWKRFSWHLSSHYKTLHKYMDSPTYTVVINDSSLYEYKLDRTEAVLKAIDEFTKYNEKFVSDYRNASEEEKKLYVADIDAYLIESSEIRIIRVYEK